MLIGLKIIGDLNAHRREHGAAPVAASDL